MIGVPRHLSAHRAQTAPVRPERARVRRIRDRLREVYGRPVAPPHGQGLDELILTVLSQSTNDRNRDVAFLRLRARLRRAGRPCATRPTTRSRRRSARAASRRSSPRGSRRSCASSTATRSTTSRPHLRRRATLLVALPGVGPQDRGVRAAVRLRRARRPRRHARLPRRHPPRPVPREGAVRGAARRRCSRSRRAARSSSST